MLNAFKEFQRVILVGGKSDVGLAVLGTIPKSRDAEVFLLGRNIDPTSISGFSKTHTINLDLVDGMDSVNKMSQLLDEADVDLVIFAAGQLGPVANETTFQQLETMVKVNYLTQLLLLECVTDKFKNQAHGKVLVFSSVTSIRPRASNYIYGSTKAGLDFYCRGIQEELRNSGSTLTIIRPGFIFSKMTKHLESVPFASTTNSVAKIAVEALVNSKNIAYAPKILKLVMGLLRVLPGRAFRLVT